MRLLDVALTLSLAGFSASSAQTATPDSENGCYSFNPVADGVLRFRRPDGRLLPEVAPPAAVPADPIHALQTQHNAQGLRLHARTACPQWLGERLDLGWAIDVLHPLAARAAGPG